MDNLPSELDEVAIDWSASLLSSKLGREPEFAVPLASNSSPSNSGESASPGADSPEVDLDVDLTEVVEIPVQGVWAVLHNRNFLRLWAGQVFSQLADKVYLVLMIALITTRFQSADQTVSGWVSAIMVAFTIPAVLFGSVAGVYVDRWPKKTVLVLTNLLRGGLVLVLPTLLWLLAGWGSIGAIPVGFWGLLGVTFCVSTLTQFFAPAEQAAIPLIVERSQLLSANSLYTLTMMVAVVVGFAAGEPLLSLADMLVSGLGITWGRELVLGGCYAIAGLLLLFLKTGENTAALNPDPPQIWQDIRDGLNYLNQQKTVRAALIQLVILFSVFAALAVLVVRMAEILPEIKSSQFGFLLAAGGVGMAIGVFILGHWGDQLTHRQLSLVGAIGMAASLSGLSLFTLYLWPSLLLLCCLGTFAALVGVPMQTTIQAETPEEMRGKIFGLQNNAVNIALSLPLVLAGVAETFLGLPTVLLVLASVVTLGGIFTWYISGSGSSTIESS
ncbi:MAG: MFS transporter [Aphanocapsa sp. GSE-SYN-MK-11-07L]|nr:MFS transporter [Aphanocapsa sp. GSE-SYN-MK-11-07L]